MIIYRLRIRIARWAAFFAYRSPPSRLDGVVQYQFGDDAELMGAWASAHNVAAPLRSKGEPDAGGGS